MTAQVGETRAMMAMIASHQTIQTQPSKIDRTRQIPRPFDQHRNFIPGLRTRRSLNGGTDRRDTIGLYLAASVQLKSIHDKLTMCVQAGGGKGGRKAWGVNRLNCMRNELGY